MESVKEFFELNMQTISEKNLPTDLPGYGTDESMTVGMGVSLFDSQTATPPVLIGNESQIEKNVTIKGPVVIGDNVIISENSHLERCVILDNTYIGQNLNISGKIVDAGRIIDPYLDLSINVTDEWLVSGNPTGAIGNLVQRLFDISISGFLLVSMFPLFTVLRTAIKSNMVAYLTDRLGSVIHVVKFDCSNNPSICERLFFKLSLHKVPLLLKVLQQNFSLIGNRH